LCTAISHLTGNKINRFTHIHQSTQWPIEWGKVILAQSSFIKN
jgi:aromatic ring hydroxylase